MIRPNNHESAAEVVVTPEFSRQLQSAGYPINVTKAFEASSHGGWHGDGSSVSVYRYDPRESPGLVSALKARMPDFEWEESRAAYGIFVDLGRLLPKSFLPSSERTATVHGQPPADPSREYIVLPNEGLFYMVKNTF
ncbi:MAG: hypothetical protein JWM59_192 [Verrucomicrobiales bacterium]|nr:hypothetical protein [Verrucomicrobiales bacterium]